MRPGYCAKVEWDGQHWLATVEDLPGAHTYAKTVASLRRRLREVIVLMDDRPDSDLSDHGSFDVELNFAAVATEVAAAQAARAESERFAAQAAVRTRDAVLWARERGISLRDTAELLGLSYQRVDQIAAGASAAQRDAS